MKNFLILFVLLITSAVASAQTMKWISMPAGTVSGKCTCETNTKINKMCYALEYTPGASGTLTSYTTGFFVNCTSIGSPVKKNESCTMTNNNKVVDLCGEYGSTFLNSSGNTGNTTQVTAGQPIILHQVCFYIPQNETLRITEDEITDLTTSITGPNNNIVTEFPVFQTQTFKMVRPDDAKPTAVIDFKASKVGDLTSQLDWTVNNLTNVKYFEVMHSSDGVEFVSIGRVESTASTSAFNTFQYIDAKAVIGKNHYKIQTVGGTADESVVRMVEFESVPFGVSVTPNPAVDYLLVDVSGATADYEIRILDAQAKLVRQQKADMRTLRTRLNIDALDAGVYTIQVKDGENTHAEFITVIK